MLVAVVFSVNLPRLKTTLPNCACTPEDVELIFRTSLASLSAAGVDIEDVLIADIPEETEIKQTDYCVITTEDGMFGVGAKDEKGNITPLPKEGTWKNKLSAEYRVLELKEQ